MFSLNVPNVFILVSSETDASHVLFNVRLLCGCGDELCCEYPFSISHKLIYMLKELSLVAFRLQFPADLIEVECYLNTVLF